jgi:hypothetical protein
MQPPLGIILPDGCLPQASMVKTKGPSTEVDPEELSRCMSSLAHRRAKKLSPERRKEIAKKAAQARWKKKR